MKVISATALIMLVMSCATTKVEIEYRVPDYVLPDFPVCSGYEITDDNEWVIISADYFIQIAKFKNEYKEFCAWYEVMKSGEVD